MSTMALLQAVTKAKMSGHKTKAKSETSTPNDTRNPIRLKMMTRNDTRTHWRAQKMLPKKGRKRNAKTFSQIPKSTKSGHHAQNYRYKIAGVAAGIRV